MPNHEAAFHSAIQDGDAAAAMLHLAEILRVDPSRARELGAVLEHVLEARPWEDE